MVQRARLLSHLLLGRQGLLVPIHAFVVTHITLTTITCMRPLYDRLPVGSRSRLRSFLGCINFQSLRTYPIILKGRLCGIEKKIVTLSGVDYDIVYFLYRFQPVSVCAYNCELVSINGEFICEIALSSNKSKTILLPSLDSEHAKPAFDILWNIIVPPFSIDESREVRMSTNTTPVIAAYW